MINSDLKIYFYVYSNFLVREAHGRQSTWLDVNKYNEKQDKTQLV